MFWLIVFILSLFFILHTYLFYPVIVSVFSKNRDENNKIFATDNLPAVSVLLAAYNEEDVISQKIQSTFNTTYPKEKIEFIIGSDASTDKTNEIIRSYQKDFPNLKLIDFPGRSGKPAIINELVKEASHDILILTDANVFFEKEVIFELLKHFKNPEISLVGGNIINSKFRKDGISIQEEAYISRENRIKYMEGKAWGIIAGAFGGCYAIRKEDYYPVPEGHMVDDFFITMKVMERGKKCITELKAVCYEDVSNKISEEFRRKVRISTGNFQNLKVFRHLIFPFFNSLSFSFLSHKVLRWLGPFFILLVLISNFFLFQKHFVFQVSLFLQIGLLLMPLLDSFLRKLKVHINLLRFIAHFYFMNGALLLGFFKFMFGKKEKTWTPTQRNQ
jgi:cellulose synthase/poly-beta-1,6-N-acetylglucosamine synthase-like glycosyltransferase